MILTCKKVYHLNSAIPSTQENLQRNWLGFIYTHKLVLRIKHFSKRPPCNHSTMSPGPVQCRCPVSMADRTGITLTACLKHMAHWQKIHISSRASLFGISQNRTKPQIPLGRAFGFFVQWLRSNTFVCGTWRLLLPTWQAGIPHASSRNTGSRVK